MVGMITEKDWREIDRVFPGMKSFYERLPGNKPKTFLELEWLFINEPLESEESSSILSFHPGH